MWQYAILGAVQGIFEWIPISSEGIVALLSQLLKTKTNPVDTALFLHLGTLVAVLIYFWRDWRDLLLLRNKRLLIFIVVATIISVIVAYPIYLLVRQAAVGIILFALTGFGLLITAILHKKKIRANLNFYPVAIITGFLQGLSVIPGLSRSGSTIFGLSLGNYEPLQILKISYMMSAPVVLGSSIYLYLQNPVIISSTWLALLISAIIGILSLFLWMKLALRMNYFLFTLIFGLLCLVGAAIGAITEFSL